MADSYFERSQEVRRELECDALFLDRARDVFDGKASPFSFGQTVNLFRVGKKLESGLWVAFRVFRPDYDFGKGGAALQMWGMEVYCKNAEHLDGLGKDVPRFCVGALYKKKAGILLEDVTANGEYKLDHPEHQPEGVVSDGERRRLVFLDIDATYRYFQGLADHKYFADDAVLDLEKRATT